MARTADDVRLLFGVLATPGPRPESGPPRVAVCPDLHGFPLEPALADAHDRLAGALHAEEVPFPEAELIVPAFRTIQLAEGHQTHRRAGLYPDRVEEYGADVRRRVEMGAELTLAELLDAQVVRETLRAAFGRLFATVDVLLTPAVPIAPPRIEDERTDPALRDAVLPYTAPQDLLGLPAYLLPNGMQLTGPPGTEARLLTVARSLAGE